MHRGDAALLVMPMCHANSLYFFGAFAYCGASTTVYSRAANVALYESAQQALSAAVKVDEVKDLLDRSAALAEYARRAATVHSPPRNPLASCSHRMFSTIISQTSCPLPCSIALAL
jgi:hypothetical protein